MLRIDGKCVIESVTPKKGKGDKLLVKIETTFTEEKLLGFAECMMSGEEVGFAIEYDDAPLFPPEAGEVKEPDLFDDEDDAYDDAEAEAELAGDE